MESTLSLPPPPQEWMDEIQAEFDDLFERCMTIPAFEKVIMAGLQRCRTGKIMSDILTYVSPYEYPHPANLYRVSWTITNKEYDDEKKRLLTEAGEVWSDELRESMRAITLPHRGAWAIRMATKNHKAYRDATNAKRCAGTGMISREKRLEKYYTPRFSTYKTGAEDTTQPDGAEERWNLTLRERIDDQNNNNIHYFHNITNDAMRIDWNTYNRTCYDNVKNAKLDKAFEAKYRTGRRLTMNYPHLPM